MTPLGRALAALKPVLDDLGVPWFVFGAQAVVVRGHPRMTADVDVTVQVDDTQIPELVRRLEAADFELRVDDVADF